MTRVLYQVFDTTYSTNDTAVFTGIGTATGDYTLCEFGLYDALTSGNMVLSGIMFWDVVNAEVMATFVCASRG